jgi:hypothetical protein
METKKMKRKTLLYKRLGWLSIVLCVLCCALPIIGASIGISAFTAWAFYLDKVGMILLGLAILLLAYAIYKKVKAKKKCSTSCSIDCSCKTKQDTQTKV